MDALPEYWNELVNWLHSAKFAKVSKNMRVAWHVNSYADSVCNGGLCDFVEQKKAKAPLTELLNCLTLVGESEDGAILEAALAFSQTKGRRLPVPKSAFIARGIAYDLLMRGRSKVEICSLIAEIQPKVERSQYDRIMASASKELQDLQTWERLNARFYDREPTLRICIAKYAIEHQAEWRTSDA
jgi:hypothetical protein